MSLQFKTTANGTAVVKLLVDGHVEGALRLANFPGIDYVDGGFQIGAANFGSGDHDYYRRNFIGDIDEVKLTGETSE